MFFKVLFKSFLINFFDYLNEFDNRIKFFVFSYLVCLKFIEKYFWGNIITSPIFKCKWVKLC